MLCAVTSIGTCIMNFNLASGKVKATWTWLIGHWFNSVLKRPFLTKSKKFNHRGKLSWEVSRMSPDLSFQVVLERVLAHRALDLSFQAALKGWGFTEFTYLSMQIFLSRCQVYQSSFKRI
jgi:hypothetical protein